MLCTSKHEIKLSPLSKTASLSLLLSCMLLHYLPIGIAHAYTFTSGSDYVMASGGIISQSNYEGTYNETTSDFNSGSMYATASGSLSGKFPYFSGSTYAYIEYDGSFHAYASAGTGKIGLFVRADGGTSDFLGFPLPAGHPSWGCRSGAEARIIDSIYYANVASPFPVLIEWNVDGTFTGSLAGETRFNATVGGPDYLITGDPWQDPHERRDDDLTDGGAYFARTLWIDPNNSGWVNPNSNAAPYDPCLLTVSGYLIVSVANGTANFSNTGAFTISYPDGLPEGVTLETASGAFLNGSTIPLPPAIILLGTGLLGLVACKRKKHK